MSYIVLARKWRPQKFDEVVGHEHIIQALENAILSGKLAQAYLFVGPRGVGKTSCTRILAKSLNCKDAPTLTPCGECSSCREISEGRSLDVIEIDGASNRRIDEIRTLRENVKFSPVSGKFKIYIIDEVHMLTQEAFNALLKTLEEPPEHVKFIFATTRPDKILPTILSRCQRFDFNRIPVLKIIAKLREISKVEKISVGEDVLFDIAKISDGSMRDAESVLDQLVTFSKNEIKSGDMIAVMGLIEQDAFFEFMEAIKRRDTQFCIDLITSLFTKGRDMSRFLEGLLWHLRSMMLAKIMSSNLKETLDLPENIIAKVIEQSRNLPLQEIINIFTAVINTQEMAKKIDSYRIPLEVMVIKLTCREPQEKPAVTESLIGSGAKMVASKIKLNNIGSLFSGPKKKDSKDPIPTIPEIKNSEELNKDGKNDVGSGIKNNPDGAVKDCVLLNLDTVSGSWPQLIDAVSEKKMSVATYLKDSRPLSLEDGVLTIGFPKRSVFYKEAIEQRHNQKIIVERINELFNTIISLRFELLEDADNQKNTGENLDNTFLKSALDTFKGRLFQKD